LGGGAIGCELAQVLRRLGSQVTVIEAAPRLLPATDPAASKVIDQVLTADGVTVRVGTEVEKVEINPNGSGLLLHLPGSPPMAADRLLIATGRTPVTDGLGLESAGVRVDEQGAVAVDRHLATTAQGVYAAGDCSLDAIHSCRLRDGPDSRPQCPSQPLAAAGQLHHPRLPAGGVHRPGDG
jgi:pyruvate/2-oxoglutarate dehydrogenase complex dihydrolipoamide dehydrogenase (E3) component